VRAALIAAALFAFSALPADALGARYGKRQLWGAIAYSSETGLYGYAVDRRTKREAESEAFRQCGSDCDLIRTFRDSCGAIAEKPGKFAWETGASQEIVEKKALKKCGAGCKIAVWACTTEK
jgi:hypothetical protein